MIDIYELYQSFVSNYNISVNGWWRLQTDFLKACIDTSSQLWDKYTSMAEKSQEVQDKLIYFLKSKNLIVKAGAGNYGICTLPAEYARFSSARILVHDNTCFASPEIDGGKCYDGTKEQEEITQDYLEGIEEHKIDKVNNIQWGACLQHKTKFPTFNKPKLTQIDAALKVAPRQVSVIVLDYYIEPALPVFTYDLVPGDPQTGSGGQIIYKKSESKPLPWPTTMTPEFLTILGTKYATFVENGFLSQSASQERQLQNIKK